VPGFAWVLTSLPGGPLDNRISDHNPSSGNDHKPSMIEPRPERT